MAWRDTLNYWNRPVREVQCWPQRPLAVPERDGRYWPDWEELPETLRRDAEAWPAREAGGALLADLDHKPLRAATLQSHKTFIRSHAPALVASGYDPAGLRGLADLVENGAVDAIRAMIGRIVLAGRGRRRRCGAGGGIWRGFYRSALVPNARTPA